MDQREVVIENYRHFPYVRIPATRSRKQSSDVLSYVYIGSNFQAMSELIVGFDSSRHFTTLSSAFNYLTQIDELDNFPDVLLFGGNFEEPKINSFLSALHKTYGVENVIAIAEVSSCTPEQLRDLRRSSLIDDLILMDTPGELLKSKVAFFKNVKTTQDPFLIAERLQTKITGENLVNHTFKRCFDIVLASLLIIILSPVLLLIAIAIKIESRGPVFYIAPRAGKGYKIFKFYKFRTMVVDADKKVDKLAHMNQYANVEHGAVFFKVSNDPRITKVGAFLRNTSMDELLQLFNVLLGNMSLVGNRPLPLYEAASLTTDDYAKRFMAPAGITGLWQIKKRGDLNMSVQERIDLDINYAEKSNFVYDLWIIANTPTALLQKSNA